MWNNAGNNLDIPAELSVNAVNNANPLFTVVPGAGGVAKLASDVFTRFKYILVDYQAVPFVLNQQHINDFITAVTQPNGPMEAALNYLSAQPGSLPQGVTTLEQFRCVIEKLWFRNSNGFKHVFVGNQMPGNNYNGFHNWYQFLLEQRRNPTQTTHIAFIQPAFEGNRLPKFLRQLSFRWRGANKGASSSMFVGTSPAFDLAMFTACVLRGRAPGGGAIGGNGNRVTDCECNIHVPAGGLPQSLVQFRTVENPQNEWVVTAYPRNVQ
ncbi:uridylate-specific endoribonuclease C-like [Pocillopora verrucosa]|uniref:uridylate-specific endoribonuclease C-like n=1 Tax=Pocillopora verrucosa TaxID=203993 RepID=UPI003340A829